MGIVTLLCLLLILVTIVSCTATVAPTRMAATRTNALPTYTTPIDVTIDLVNVQNDKVKVTIHIDSIDMDTVHYYIPKIVPGTYQNNDYGDYIEQFTALDLQGNTLATHKHGKNQWGIQNARQLHSITYWVNDTFDTEDTHQIFSPTGTNIEKGQNFILNLYAFIGYFDKMKERAYTLHVIHPPHLEAATSAEELPSTNETDRFSFSRYAAVTDAPIMYTAPENKASFNINEVEVLLSIYSPNNIHKVSNLLPQMERMIRAQKNFLGSINATKKYSVLVYLSSATQGHARGFGALEHNTSTVVVLPESLPLERLNESLTDVVSHEFFHIVTPLNIHSEEIHNFDYNNPKMSKHLWLYEGTTEYFSMLFQIHQGLISKEEFFNRILDKINDTKHYDDTMSFTEMSEHILVAPYHKNYPNVYEKGALISMCIDIIIREQTYSTSGIVDLIHQLSKTFGAENPFKDDELIQHIRSMSYPSVADFLETHVVGNTPIDYMFYLHKAGVGYGMKEIPSQYFLDLQEPLIKGSESTNEIVFTSGVANHNFLSKAGIKGGDILLSINDKKYTIKNIYDLFGDSKKWRIGDTVLFTYKRAEKILTTKVSVIEPKIQQKCLHELPNPTDTQTSILKGWIND